MRRSNYVSSICWIVLTLFLSGTFPLSLRAKEPDQETTQKRVYIDVRRSNVRAGPGSEFHSLRVMSAGQGLDVVGSDGNWLKVSLSGGKTGWVSKRAVTSTPPAPVVVKNLKRDLEAVQTENDQLQEEIGRLSDARQDLELENSKLKSEVTVLTAQNEELQSWRLILWVVLGLVVLFVGWGLGYLTGMFRRQSDDKRYERLMREAGGKSV